MVRYVLDVAEIERTRIAEVGGKGANLGELARIDGVRVPGGFCVTTEAFRRVVAEAPVLNERLDRLTRLQADAHEAIRALSAEIRAMIEAIAVPDELAAEIASALARHGVDAATAYAVRSSATAEDLPTASFAGQQESFLNVVGTAAVIHHVSRCWASLFTERAVTYRLRNGIDQRKVAMAVVVQRMVFPDASGILFTADPVSGNRKIASIEAVRGLGEALVSGLVPADGYKVRDGEIVERSIAAKPFTLRASADGGTRREAIPPERQMEPALTDAQVVRLAALGRRIEAHFERPQDIEWCLVGDDVQIVQSRPITTLFPVPEAGDAENHVYISVGHPQMMTDAMKPLGIAFWQMTTPRPMQVAGGRLFVDVTKILASPVNRPGFLDLMGRSDPLMRDALETLLARGDFVREVPDEAGAAARPVVTPAGEIDNDPAIVSELIARNRASVAALANEIRDKSGPELLDFILADLQELRRLLFDPLSHKAAMAGMEASWWLTDHLQEWLGDWANNAVDVLTQSAPNNNTSEMGLALLDVADAIRPYPEVVAFLERGTGDGFLDELPRLRGGQAARDAIVAYLDTYGVRGAGEIDITRPRWRERPSTLLPVILGNIAAFGQGEHARRFERGRQEAEQKAQEVLARLRALQDGEQKAAETKRMIDQLRTFIGYREYPKFGMISRYFFYRQALLAEADRLVREGVLREPDELFFLTFQELQEVVRTRQVDRRLIDERKEAFASYQTLTPPRVLTSEGEAVAGSYRRGGVPEGALVGLPVSAGTVEGRARVVLDMAAADLEAGDILVTAFTDPSWTPLFVAIGGLVTEVGGLMTHGSVIAREYGLPAVVGVEQATRLIRDGQRIRVHGTEGYVEILG